MMNIVAGAAIQGVAEALQTTASDVTDTMLAALPYALGVFALGYGVRKVLSFFKSASRG